MKKFIVLAATAMVASTQSLYELFEKKVVAASASQIEDNNLENLAISLERIIPCDTNAYCRTLLPTACCLQIINTDSNTGFKTCADTR